MSQVDNATKIPEILSLDQTLPKEAALLTKILKNNENDPDLKIQDVQLTKPCSSGDNYTSLIQRAIIKYKMSDGKILQKSFIMKVQMQDEERKSSLMADEIWANEEVMYKKKFPALRRVCNEDLPIPKFYYSDANVMVMEDLKESGFVMRERANGLDFEHTLLVMDKLAQLHAASLCLQVKDNNNYTSFKNSPKHPYVRLESIKKTSPYIKKSLSDAISILLSDPKSESFKTAVDKLKEISDNQETYFPMLQSIPEGNSGVLVHGDLWLNNTMFSYDSATKDLVDVKFVDFQASRMGSAAVDIHHFLYTSVDPKIRKLQFDDILMHYHTSCYKYLKQFLDGVNDEYLEQFTFERLKGEIFHYRLYGLVNALLFLPVVLNDDKSKYDFFDLDSTNTTLKLRQGLVEVVDEYLQRNWITLD